MSRIVPNSYQKPNLYTDRLMHLLTGDEWKTLDYALRRTFGFNRERDRISVSQFMSGNGHCNDAGEPVEFGTGLGRSEQVAAIHELMRFGILIEVAPNNAQKHGRLWELQLDEKRIRFDLLLERREAKKARGRARTAAARATQVARSPGMSGPADVAVLAAETSGLSDTPVQPVCTTDRYWSVGQTDTGVSDRPTLVCGTDTQKSSKKPSRNTGETQSLGEVAPEPVVETWRALLEACEGDESLATAVWRLQVRFAALTQLRLPDPATARGRERLRDEWWPHLLQMLEEAGGDPALAEAAIGEAFRSMTEREKPLHVVGPRSIVNVAAGVIAGQRRGMTPGASSGRQRPKGMKALDAYAERRGLHGN